MGRTWLARLFALAAVALGACATIPDGRYGVDKLELTGVEQLDPYALRACLATRERDWLAIDLSKDPAPTCGKPPFDAKRVHLPLWRWPWTDWPLYDPSVFERDLARIERWYRARGYYDARILDATSEPPEGLYGTRTGDKTLRLKVSLVEGPPVLVFSVSLSGTQGLPEKVSEALIETANTISPDDRFDEAEFDRTKLALVRILRDAGYASAAIEGRVDIDPAEHSAIIGFTVKAGPFSEFGDVCVEGHGKLPPRLILQASDLRPGHAFSESDLEDARTRIYQMRVFSEVEIIAGRQNPITGASEFRSEEPTRQGEWLAWQDGVAKPVDSPDADDEGVQRVCRLSKSKTKRARVPIEIRVKPAKLYRLGVGAGIQIGIEDGQQALNATQQWDVHLYAYAEVRNFIGGLRRLRIEERPKLIFLAPFPRLENTEGERLIRLGNNLSTLLEWPAFLEARTLLRVTADWDRGPDPYGARFIRDDINVGLGPTRSFLRNRLRVSANIHFNSYIPRFVYGELSVLQESAAQRLLRNERYDLLFLQQIFEWDTRDDRVSPRRGTFVRLEVHETLPPSEWGYVRLTPEVRGFAPLPYGLVLAGRAGIGLIEIYETTANTEELRRLGPRPYRLRGGGPYSVRGVQAGLLGQRETEVGGVPGGTRSWIASLELRIPLGDSFAVATFVDVGDVDSGSVGETPRFRFDRPNTTLGGGLRYKTIVGPVRLDVGWLVPGLQGNTEELSVTSRRDPLFKFSGAVFLTIGEAF